MRELKSTGKWIAPFFAAFLLAPAALHAQQGGATGAPGADPQAQDQGAQPGQGQPPAAGGTPGAGAQTQQGGMQGQPPTGEAMSDDDRRSGFGATRDDVDRDKDDKDDKDDRGW